MTLTHEEKLARIAELDRQIKAADELWDRLVREKADLLNTRTPPPAARDNKPAPQPWRTSA